MCYHIAETVKQVPLGQNFAVIGHNEHYKNIRTPPLHPGCRCSQLAILTPEYGGPENPQWGKTAVQPKVEEGSDKFHAATPDHAPSDQPKIGPEKKPEDRVLALEAVGDVSSEDAEMLQNVMDQFPDHLLQQYRDFGGSVKFAPRVVEL